jgi:protein-disulfide isomerase
MGCGLRGNYLAGGKNMSTQSQRGRKVQARNTQKTLRNFYIALAVVAVVGIGILAFYLVGNAGSGPATGSSEQISPIDAPTGITPEGFYYKGDPEAPVTVIEYSDFQCPACARYHTVLGGDVDSQYVETGQIQFIFHEFPVTDGYAVAAAEAARAAGEQGQFWPMHDLLFENQDEWRGSMNPESLFINYAEQLGLDRDQFAEALRSNKYQEQVQVAEQSAMQAGIQATPSFVVNGRQVSANDLILTIESELDAQGE